MDKELDKIPKPDSPDFELEAITSMNFRPHPYCITPDHVGFASDRYFGMLGEEAIQEAEREKKASCGMYINPDTKECHNGPRYGYWRCNVPYEGHTADRVLFIRALVDKPIKELTGLQDYLKSIVDKLKELKIDGVAFIEPKK
jgi:hypothetical protein